MRQEGAGEAGTGDKMMERLQCLAASNSPCHLRGHMSADSLGCIFTPRFVLDHLPLSPEIGPSSEPNVAFIQCIVSCR